MVERSSPQPSAQSDSLLERIAALETARVDWQRGELHYRKLLDYLDVGVFVSDIDGRLLEVNGRVVELAGYDSADELLQQPAQSLYAEPADREQMIQVLRRDGRVHKHEMPSRRRDGSVYWISLSAMIIEEASGSRTILGLVEDITERRRIEAQLFSERERFRVIAEQSLLGIALVQDDRIAFANRAVSEIVGYSVEEMLKWPALDYARLVHPDDLAFVIEQAERKRLDDPSALTRFEYRLITSDGAVRWVEQYSLRIEQQTGPAVFVTMVDVTARKNAELLLHQEKERLAVTLRSIGEGVATTDVHGAVDLLNPAAERLTGWTNAEARGLALRDVLRLSERSSRLTARDGSLHDVSVNTSELREADGTTIGKVVVIRDVDKELALAQSLERAAKLESLGVLAAGIAHDFNNLLAGLWGYVDLARAACTPDHPAVRYLDHAGDALDRTRALTLQLLTFAKGGAPQRRTGSVAEVAIQCTEFALRGTSVMVEFDFAPDLWSVDFDQHQIGQVIDNLVLNARHAMGDRGTLRVIGRNLDIGADEVTRLPRGPYVKLSIVDEGPGIPHDVLTRVFDPFFTTKTSGSGLGLSTAYAIATRHEGTIEAESRPGNGATFHLFLPAAPGKPPSTVSRADFVHQGAGAAIVMDDQAPVRDVLCRMLRHMGYDALPAADGAEAIAAVKRLAAGGTAPAIVFLDLTVRGGVSGKEALAGVRALAPTVPVIASSGYSDDPEMADPNRYGFTASLRKPFRMADITSLLEAVVPKPRR